MTKKFIEWEKILTVFFVLQNEWKGINSFLCFPTGVATPKSLFVVQVCVRCIGHLPNKHLYNVSLTHTTANCDINHNSHQS